MCQRGICKLRNQCHLVESRKKGNVRLMKYVNYIQLTHNFLNLIWNFDHQDICLKQSTNLFFLIQMLKAFEL